MKLPTSHADYARVARAITYLRARSSQQPQLDEVADHVGLSPYHFQRLFSRWAGVSPKRFLQYVTVEHAKTLLGADRSLLDTTYATGLSSPSRLYDLFVAAEAVTPGEYKSRGRGIEIRYGIAESPFGSCLVAGSARGLVALSFLAEGAAAGDRDAGGGGSTASDDGVVTGDRVAMDDGAVTDATAATERLHQDWSGACLRRDDDVARRTVSEVFDGDPAAPVRQRLLLRGTNFQLRVWRALLEVPFGTVTTYGQVAGTVCSPAAARAVGNAVGANPIAYLIPCHRVIRANGEIGSYRWGTERKASMLGWEQARQVG